MTARSVAVVLTMPFWLLGLVACTSLKYFEGADAGLEPGASEDGTRSKDGGRTTPDTPADAAPDGEGDDSGATLHPQTLGQFVDPMLSFAEDVLLVMERTTDRQKMVLIRKDDPTSPKTIYDEPSDSPATRVRSAAVARGQVWFTTGDKKLRRMTLAGTNPVVVDESPSDVLARAPNTVWTASPDSLSSAPTLRWIGADLLSEVPEVKLALSGPVMFVAGGNQELLFSSRTRGGRWTLNRWRPFTSEPSSTFATFDAYPSWVCFDAERALVYVEDEATIVSWSHLTPQVTPTTVLVNVPAPVAIKSDGKNLVMRSQTSLATCEIARCASTLREVPVPSPFTKARALEIDEHWAYFFHARSDGPMTLVRVPR
jgi:hypothetical protein